MLPIRKRICLCMTSWHQQEQATSALTSSPCREHTAPMSTSDSLSTLSSFDCVRITIKRRLDSQCKFVTGFILHDEEVCLQILLNDGLISCRKRGHTLRRRFMRLGGGQSRASSLVPTYLVNSGAIVLDRSVVCLVVITVRQLDTDGLIVVFFTFVREPLADYSILWRGDFPSIDPN